jgi:hypothetical protein
MLKDLTEVEQDISYARGFVEEWLKDAPAQVKENFQLVNSGISVYREKYLAVQEDHAALLDRYNALAIQAAQYLEFSRQQKELLDERLIEEQREFHDDAKRTKA